MVKRGLRSGAVFTVPARRAGSVRLRTHAEAGWTAPYRLDTRSFGARTTASLLLPATAVGSNADRRGVSNDASRHRGCRRSTSPRNRSRVATGLAVGNQRDSLERPVLGNRYEPLHSLQDLEANRRTFATTGADPIRHSLRSLCWARMLFRHAELEIPTRRSGANMNSIAATLVISERVRQRLLPHDEAWRCQGEYVGGCLCDGCGERITSAQAFVVRG